MARFRALRRVTKVIWSNLHTNDLWQRIVKYSIATTIAVIIAILPPVISRFGKSTFLIPVQTVFAHPGQRMGLMIESQTMIFSGSLLGMSWGVLGLYFSSLVVDSNKNGAYAIRAVFLLCAVLAHGFLRSYSPRLFNFVLFLLIASTMVLVGAATSVSASIVTGIMYPVLTGNAILVVINITVFPELSSRFLGTSTIDTLSEAVDTLTRATTWFVTPGGDNEELKPLGPNAPTGNTGKNNTKKNKSKKKKRNKKRKSKALKIFDSFQNPFRTNQGRRAMAGIPHEATRLVALTEAKGNLRAKFTRCKAAQQEVNFEVSISALPLAVLRPISTVAMGSLVQNAITLIGACENKLVMLSDVNDKGVKSTDELGGMVSKGANVGDENFDTRLPGGDQDQEEPLPADHTSFFKRPAVGRKRSSTKDEFLRKLEFVKPLREIEAGDAELLESILVRIRKPVQEFEVALKQAVALVTSCLAYCYDVPKLPSGARAPKGIRLEEIDLRIDLFTSSIALFDRASTDELERAAVAEGNDVDIMPRMETFLVSSFLLGLRQAAVHILQMLRHARILVEKRQERKDRARIYWPHYTGWREWLSTGGEEDGMVLPESARKDVRAGKKSMDETGYDTDNSSISEAPLIRPRLDEEIGGDAYRHEIEIQKLKRRHHKEKKKKKKKRKVESTTWIMRVRGRAADAVEWVQDSEDLKYAMKLAVAVAIVTWPGLLSSWHDWYSNVRGVWAPLQLILVFEVAIGTSFFVFLVRLFGVVFGCLVGYLSYEIGRGNRAVTVVVLVFGIVPSIYIQVGTKYVKAGMISIVSMTVVALATVNRSGTAYENFYYRLIAFIIGGCVALLIEVCLYPVRARDRMAESLSSAVCQVMNMQAAVAVGIDDPINLDLQSHRLYSRFNRARDKAQGALAAAETFLPFCLSEPRIKGSFKRLAPIYREIIYVLHQIIDRMDNVLQLRKAYGSSVLEDLNPQVYAYRRNVAASVTIALFAINEALTTRLPLPQFLPSSRLAQLRLVNRVREVLAARPTTSRKTSGLARESAASASTPNLLRAGRMDLDEHTAKIVTQHKFLSWNASTAGQMEIIEYLEELLELAKLLVGVNAFRSGMLERPNFRQYMRRIKTRDMSWGQAGLLKTSAGLATMDPPSGGPEDEAGDGDGDDGGQPRAPKRAPTFGESRIADRLRDKLGDIRRRRTEKVRESSSGASSSSSDDDEGEVIPMSLQRVGTRLRDDESAARRRRAWSSLSAREGGASVAGAGAKGKGIDRVDE